MATLYKHQIFCLHGLAGQVAADIAAADTVFPVEFEVLQDVTIKVGSLIQLRDGTNQSPSLTILAIDQGTTTITVDRPVGHDFQETTPTEVYRLPHPVSEWTESPAELTVCPEDPSHAVQPGSAVTLEVREPVLAQIIQSQSNLTRPAAWGQRLDVPSGGTGVIEFSWPYKVTVRSMIGYFETSNVGDRYDVISGPNTPIGTLNGPVGSGVSVLPVSDSVIAYARPALLCVLAEGATTNNLGRIISVDSTLNTITVETATTDAFTAAAGVLVTNVHTLDMPVPQVTTPVSVGGDEIEGRDAQPGMIVRVTYRNAGPNPSTALAIIKFLT